MAVFDKRPIEFTINMVSPVSFSVEYNDPVTNDLRTGNFYCGDRVAPALIIEITSSVIGT